MKHKTILPALVLLLICLATFSCKKKDRDDENFCTLINEQNFDATLPLVDNFLAKLDGNNEARLEKLKNWLTDKSCINTASIVCHSCILTGPPQSELSVEFNANGQDTTLILDIIMGETLKTRTYH